MLIRLRAHKGLQNPSSFRGGPQSSVPTPSLWADPGHPIPPAEEVQRGPPARAAPRCAEPPSSLGLTIFQEGTESEEQQQDAGGVAVHGRGAGTAGGKLRRLVLRFWLFFPSFLFSPLPLLLRALLQPKPPRCVWSRRAPGRCFIAPALLRHGPAPPRRVERPRGNNRARARVGAAAAPGGAAPRVDLPPLAPCGQNPPPKAVPARRSARNTRGEGKGGVGMGMVRGESGREVVDAAWGGSCGGAPCSLCSEAWGL